jgi:Domain of unknown function (DUF6468)
MNIYSLTMEAILASLLLIAIAYCMRLDGKLKALRTGNTRMLEAAKELRSAVVHAESAVNGLRRSADAVGKELQAKIDEARAMAAQPLVREPVLVDRDPPRGPPREYGREPARDSGRTNSDFALRRRSSV